MIEIDWNLLLRYVEGDCTQSERERLEQWLSEAPENAEVLAGVREAAALARKAVSPERSAAMLASLRRELAARRVTPPTFALAARSRWSTPLKIAASIVVVAGAGLAGRFLFRAPAERAATAPSFNVVSTTRGQRLSVRLADGTQVTLGPGTTLRTPSTYGVRDRTVQLEGEAVFTVTHDATRPFAVETRRALARDLGTRFVVRAYADDPQTDVVVAEGQVGVTKGRGAGGDSLVLERGSRARVSADGALELTRNVSLDRYFAWTEGRLVFRATPLREAVAQLSRWYDIDIRLASNAIGAEPLDASFQDEPAPEALRIIAAVLKLDVSQSGRTYTLRAR